MPADAHRAHTRGLGVAAGLAVSGGYALAAAATTPFTWPANVIAAIPIAVAAVLAVVSWPARPDRSALLVVEGFPRPRRPYRGWVVLLAVVAGWELVEYLWRGSRSAHPTLSSMADALDAPYIGRAVAFGAWLWLGAAIVRAGTPLTARWRASWVPPA